MADPYEWGHLLYKFAKSEEISVKYELTVWEFKILSGAACPH
jgi:hypothetical protein